MIIWLAQLLLAEKTFGVPFGQPAWSRVKNSLAGDRVGAAEGNQRP
jgi:hypothetical protein